MLKVARVFCGSALIAVAALAVAPASASVRGGNTIKPWAKGDNTIKPWAKGDNTIKPWAKGDNTIKPW